MNSIIETTRQYVKKRLLSELEREHGDYRYTHTLRVADLGHQIATAEGLDEEMLVLGCLLHDIGYVACRTREDYEDHGLKSALIAAEFMTQQGYDAEKAERICYGIRVHTQPEEERSRPATVLEDSISDADNIDRFDAWRFAQALCREEMEGRSTAQLLESVQSRLQRLTMLKDISFATETARKLWHDRLTLWEDFYTRLRSQMEATCRWDPDL